jgi:hypothetical protein
MKMIDLGSGWYVNPAEITYIRPHRDKHAPDKVEIHFATEIYVHTDKTPEEIAAQITAADTGLESSVKNLIDASVRSESLLAAANVRVQELTDRLALFEAELKALREITLPLP